VNGKKIAVAIVEDERATRENLVLLLNRAKELRCVGAFGSAEHALKEISLEPLDVLLMDLELPGLSSVECIRRLKDLFPALKILALTKFEDADHIFQALKAGANGYLSKQIRAEELFASIRSAYEGAAPISAQVAVRIVQYFNQESAAPANHARENLPALSRRERQVLELLAQGFPDKEIACTLGISVATVNDYTKNIYAKLHVRSRGEAVAKFLGR